MLRLASGKISGDGGMNGTWGRRRANYSGSAMAADDIDGPGAGGQEALPAPVAVTAKERPK
jgi:hypothetical protein